MFSVQNQRMNEIGEEGGREKRGKETLVLEVGNRSNRLLAPQ